MINMGNFDTEESLVEAFISNFQYDEKKFIMREVDCWQGRADVVEVIYKNIHDELLEFSEQQIYLLQNLTCANLISILNYKAVRSRQYIYKALGIQHKSIDNCLKKLINAGIVTEKTKDRFIIHSEFILPLMKFTAYEVKLYNWKRALYQAIQYKGFANKSYVVMPQKNISPAIKNKESFLANKIGLIQVNEDGGYKLIITAKEVRPTGKSYNLVGIGIALNQIRVSSFK